MNNATPSPDISPNKRQPFLPKLLFLGKIAFVGFLVLLMYLPMGMVQSLIQERNQRHDAADWEVIKTWGGAQTLAGPFLIVPYRSLLDTIETDDAGRERKKTTIVTRYAYFLPEQLTVTGAVKPEARYRSIYRTLLYQSDLEVSGKFLKPDFASLHVAEKDILWKEAVVFVGIPHMRAIQEEVSLNWNSSRVAFRPGSASSRIFEAGIEAPVQDFGAPELPFSFRMKLAGSEKLQFLPFGKETKVSLVSPWADPSFIGAYLPDAREIGEKGFSAEWKVLHLGRNYPQQWTEENHWEASYFQDSAFGVSLIFPVDTYQKTTRSAKYAILFILLTFVTFFLFEIFQRFKIHPVQYLLVGFGLCLFYVLLLSLSEHIGFAKAYLAASFATVSLIAGYSSAVLKSGWRAALMGGVMAGLYAYLYILLQMQDFALLMGALGLFFILGLIMWITRKVDWYALNAGKPAGEMA